MLTYLPKEIPALIKLEEYLPKYLRVHSCSKKAHQVRTFKAASSCRLVLNAINTW